MIPKEHKLIMMHLQGKINKNIETLFNQNLKRCSCFEMIKGIAIQDAANDLRQKIETVRIPLNVPVEIKLENYKYIKIIDLSMIYCPFCGNKL